MTESAPESAPVQKAPSERAVPAAASNDKRQHPRFKVEGATAVVGKPGFLAGLFGPRKHQVVNLSQGGAMIRVGRKLAIEGRHELRIEIPKYQETIAAVGEVRWCLQSAKKASDIYAGFHFVAIAESERRKLARMHDLFTSTEYKALAPVRKDASSVRLKAPKL